MRPCAPTRSGCFPADGPDRSNGKEIWLVYGTRHETDIYYQDEFEALARRVPNFHYLPTLSRALDSWTGLRGHVQVHVSKIIEERAARLGQPLPAPPVDPAIPPADLRFDIYCLHLRPELHGLWRARAAGRLRLAQEADCLRALRLNAAGSTLQLEQLPEPLGLRAADGDLRLLLVVHAQLVAGFEPGHHFADLVDVDHEAAMGAPETRWIEQFEQLLESAALGLALEGRG